MINKNISVDARIRQMYEQGYSCKDISSVCGESILAVRQQLRACGFDTRSYRKASDYNKQKVMLLVYAGYSYSQIEQLLHVSTHLIREIVAANGLTGNIARVHPPIQLNVRKQNISDELLHQMRTLYLSGLYGLARCAEELSISDDEFMWFVYHLSEKEIRVHHKLLVRTTKALCQKGASVASIAKQLGISPAVVKRALQADS